MTESLRTLGFRLIVAIFFLATGANAFGQFETRASISTGTYQPISVAVGDFNRDGKLDVAVVTDTPTGNVLIFLGNGDGTFSSGASYPVSIQPFYASAASLRNNGILDLVVGDSLSDNVYVMLGNGDGTFQTAVSYPTSGRPAYVGAGDFNGDGRLDIIALAGPAAECNCVEVLPGNGDGTFGPAAITQVPYNVDGFGMATGDFDGDGILDAAVSGAFASANQVDILRGNGDGSFRPDGYYPVSLIPVPIATGFFSGGTKIDLAVGNLEGGSISVLIGNGNGTFRQAVDYDTANPAWVAAGDLNGDGRDDLVASIFSAANPPSGSVSVLVGNGDGTFQPGVIFPAGEQLAFVAIGDFNGDHKPDLVVVDGLGDAVITLLNTGVVIFSPTAPLTFPPQLLGKTSGPLTATLTNNGTSPLTISSVSSSGKPFHTQTTCKGSIAAGRNCSITATFTAQAAGLTSGTFTIHDGASSKPQVVELVGTGTEVKFSPSQLTFPPQKKGTKSSPESFRVTNIGSSAFDFTYKIYVSGTGNSYKNFLESNNCPTSLNAGASCTVRVTFAPRQTGPINGLVVFTDTGGGSPQSVPLSGTGD